MRTPGSRPAETSRGGAFGKSNTWDNLSVLTRDGNGEVGIEALLLPRYGRARPCNRLTIRVRLNGRIRRPAGGRGALPTTPTGTTFVLTKTCTGLKASRNSLCGVVPGGRDTKRTSICTRGKVSANKTRGHWSSIRRSLNLPAATGACGRRARRINSVLVQPCPDTAKWPGGGHWS
jgi:hypothetical protein